MAKYLIKEADGKTLEFNLTNDFYNHYKIDFIQTVGIHTKRQLTEDLQLYGINYDDFYNNCYEDSKYIIDTLTETGEIVCDEGGSGQVVYDEYRVYLVDNKVVSQSEYKDYYYNHAYSELINHLERLHNITIYQRVD